MTSVSPGNGGNLGGLAGADAHCQKLASAAGAGGRTWRAYLSATASSGRTVVHARDRIGAGPWLNAKGVQIAGSLAELHLGRNRVAPGTALDERGNTIARERHDMLTGSNAEGTAVADATCGNWTSNGAGRAMVGHHDRAGGPTSWNSNHLSQGCSLPALRASGGDGLFYCFAVN